MDDGGSSGVSKRDVMFDAGRAKKVATLIEEFYNIAKARFADAFGHRLHMFDPKDKDIVRQLDRATVVTLRERKSGKKCMVVSYLATENFAKQVEQKIFPHIHSYHRGLLHEYAEVFLFYHDLLNPPTVKVPHLEMKREQICDRFAKALLKLA